MPFTASHPAAVLPVIRLGLPASALVIGSLVPDLPYYLPTPFTFVETHALPWALARGVLLGLVAFLVWHALLVRPLMWLAPAGLQRRIPYRGGWPVTSVRELGAACLALAIGVLTHVVWDLFTHVDGLGLHTVPALNTMVGGLPALRWLHLISTIGGLAALAWYGVRWWSRSTGTDPADPVHPALRWSLIGLLFAWAGVAAGRVLSTQGAPSDLAGLQTQLIETTLALTTTFATGVLLFATVWHVARSARLPRRAQSATAAPGGRRARMNGSTSPSAPAADNHAR